MRHKNRVLLSKLFSFCFASVTISFTLAITSASAAPMPSGYYMGFGDNAHVALQVMTIHHGVQKAIVSASHSGKNYADILAHGDKNSGIITPSGKAGRYIMTFNQKNNYPVCRYSLTYNKQGKGYMFELLNHKEFMGCMKYQWFNMSYSTPIASGALKRVSGLK